MTSHSFILAIGLPSGTDILMMSLALMALIFVGPVIFQLLWNSTIPEIFGLPVIRFWQAFRLLILAAILFGGMSQCGRNPPQNVYVGQPPYDLKH